MRKLAARIVKYSLFLLATIVVILLVAPFFINVNDYKQTVIDKAEMVTGRQITVGSMHLSLFPWVGVRLTDLHVRNRPGFSAEDFVSAKNLDVQVDLLPLLSKRVVIKRFVLDEPHVRLERNVHGEDSWTDLLPQQGTSAAHPATSVGGSGGAVQEKGSSPAAGGLVALSAETLRVSGGEFVYRDAVSNTSVVLNELRLDVNHAEMNQPIQVSASGMLNGNKFRVDGQMGPVGDLAKLDASHLPAQFRLQADKVALSKFRPYMPALKAVGSASLSIDARFEQRPDGVRLSAGGVELAAGHDVGIDWKAEMPDAGRIEIQSMKLQLDDRAMGDASGEVKGLGGDVHYQLRAKVNPVSRETVAAWVPTVQSLYAGNPNPWKKIGAGLLATGDASHLQLRDLQLQMDDEVVQVSGAIGFTGDPDIRLRILSKAFHVDPWLPQPKENRPEAVSENGGQTTVDVIRSSLSPVASASAATLDPVGGERISTDGGAALAAAGGAPSGGNAVAKEPDLRFLRSWHVNAQMQVHKLFLHGLTLQNLRATMQGRDGRFTLEPLQFDLSGGRVEERGSILVKYYPARWSESAHISDVQVRPVLLALAKTDMVSGVMQMDTNLHGIGLLPKRATASLSGSGKVRVRNGTIKGVDIPGTLRRLTAPGQQQGPKSTDFSELSASFEVDHGRVSNDDLFMASPLFRLTGHGQINLASKTMDYHLKPRLIGSLIGQGDTEAVRRGLVVPLRLIGPIEQPKVQVEVDPATLIQNAEALKGMIKKLKKPDANGTSPEEQIRKKLKQLLPLFR
ncbi:MAG TPA: AsmA family protein [Mariprofundaceae bacterium]|nr:AsmA family protein [Mariprofundaceae bacterium]